MLSRCHFLRWQPPSAAEEVVDLPAPRINIDASRVKITIAPHFRVSVCGRGGAGRDYSSQLWLSMLRSVILIYHHLHMII